MILVVDSSALTLLVNPGAHPPADPDSGRPLERAKERVEYLIATMTPNDTLIVPTPVLAELLVKAMDGGPAVMEQLHGMARVRIQPFDERAAVELASMTRESLEMGRKKADSTEPWQKVKFDRQIIAIARVAQATRIYADDRGLIAFAKSLGMDAVSTWELPVPETAVNLFTATGFDAGGRSI